MRIIEIQALSNGAHRNQNGFAGDLPLGWAVIPEGMTLRNFPFGKVTAAEVAGVMTLVDWSPLPIPKPEEVEPELTWQDTIEAQVTYTAMMTDTLLEV